MGSFPSPCPLPEGEGFIPREGETLVSLLARRLDESGSREALFIKRNGDWQSLTWDEVAHDALRAAAALTAAGLKPGDRVVQLSENRYEWIVCDLAVHLARGVHVALHASLSAQQVAEQVRDCGARLALVSTREQAEKLAGAADLRVWCYDPLPAEADGIACGHWADALAAAGANPSLLSECAATVQPADLATILYTSGTTGEPKGVMLSHGNLAFNTVASLEAFGARRDELRLCWLPLSHIFARTADLYAWIASGCRLALAESRETIVADCLALHPTTMNGVPYFYEKVMRHLQSTGQADKPGSLAALLGGRMRFCCSGGAALPDHVAAFFDERGVPLTQGYGMTESSPVITMGSLERNHRGTVGPPIAGVEVQIAPDGEVLTRGPHVMLGYWQKPAATRETLRDGWLHTGDLGCLEDGYLRITGRKKELIVTAAGKNVAPTLLEGLLVADPLISQVMVVGDARKYLAALVVPDLAALAEELSRRQVSLPTPEQLLHTPAVRALYAERIAERLAPLSHCEQVQRFALLPRPFSVEAGELTPTLKLRRAVIAANFAAEIAELYN